MDGSHDASGSPAPPEDMTGIDEMMKPDIPDPLDDYAQISDDEIRIRTVLRGHLVSYLVRFLILFSCGFLALYALYFSDFSTPIDIRIIFWILCGPLAICLYLVLVRLDTGRWSLIHPSIVADLLKCQNKEKVLRLLAIFNLAFLMASFVYILAGFPFFTRWDMGLSVIVCFMIVGSALIIIIFGEDWSKWEYNR